MERLQTKLQSAETENKTLTEKVTSLELSLGSATSEREDLRTINGKSSADLKKALGVLYALLACFVLLVGSMCVCVADFMCMSNFCSGILFCVGLAKRVLMLFHKFCRISMTTRRRS